MKHRVIANLSYVAARPGTVPAGSQLLVRLDETLDSARTPAGQGISADEAIQTCERSA